MPPGIARLFSVTTDYLLGLDDTSVIRTDGLTGDEISAVLNTIKCFRDARGDSTMNN